MHEKILEIEKLLQTAQKDINSMSASNALKMAEKEAQELIVDGGDIASIRLLSSILVEQAYITTDLGMRNKLWQRALSVLTNAYERTKDARLSLELGYKIIDYIEDEYVFRDRDELQKAYVSAKKILDDSIDQPSNSDYRGPLLGRKSSLLRFGTLINYPFQFDGDPKERYKKLAEQANRCANRAVKESARDGKLVLEEGLSFWLLARYTRDDLEYNTLLEQAENKFWEAAELGESVPALLTLARFFRQTYQPAQCCDAFSRYLTLEEQKRRAWRNSYIYGEAILQLWFAKYPPNLIEKFSDEAEILLEQAVDSGYRTARIILSLAFIKSCKGDEAGGKNVLTAMFDDQFSWTKAIDIGKRFAEANSSSPLISKGLALGINDGRVWNKLGTYALTFLNDEKLSEQLYGIAIILAPNDPISLTNLARLLIKKGTANDIQEAKRLLAKASKADLRFKWWRVVQSSLEAHKKVQTEISIKHIPSEHVSTLKEIRYQFRFFKNLQSPITIQMRSDRGKALNNLFYKLVKITLQNAIGPHKIRPSAELDGALYYNKECYKYELKWEEAKIGAPEIRDFAGKINNMVWGLFISISGFTSTAVDEAKRIIEVEQKKILLMDGKELELIIENFLPFDIFMVKKQTYFYFYNEPYYNVNFDDLATC